MERIDNEHGIEMFWEINGTDAKIDIFDSNGNYFNDLCYDSYDGDEGEEDIQAILHTLEQTTIEEMAYFFNAKVYTTLEELANEENLLLEDLKNNDYVNVFNVNNKTHYTWSWSW